MERSVNASSEHQSDREREGDRRTSEQVSSSSSFFWQVPLSKIKKVVVMRQVKISHAGYQQPSTKLSSFIPQAWNNVFCREFPIMSSWGDECDCVVGVCLHACVCLVCDWGSSWIFSSVQYALRYAEMRHKYCWIKRSTLSNPTFTMESLITHGCALGVCEQDGQVWNSETQSVSLHVCLFIAHWSGQV